MATERARFQAHVDGLVGGDFPLSFLFSSQAAIGTRFELDLVIGVSANGFATQPNTTLVVLVPPVTNTTPIRLQGTALDTGFFIAAHRPTIVSVKPIPPSSGVAFTFTVTSPVPGFVIYEF